MTNFKFDSSDLKIVAALYCEGMAREDIAHVLCVSENDVQRMIEAAEGSEYFTYTPKLTLAIMDHEVEEVVYGTIFTDTLRKTLQSKLEFSVVPVTITPSPIAMFRTYKTDAIIGSKQWKEYNESEWQSTQMVCRRAAQELSKFLLDGKPHIVGLNWGAMVKETIRHIAPLPSLSHNKKITVVSLFGDLEFHFPGHDIQYRRSIELNSNKLVNQLVQRLGGQAEAIPLNVPGFIPVQFSHNIDSFEAIRSFLTSHSSYRKIFGATPIDSLQKPQFDAVMVERPADSMISRIDTIVTGFGSADNYTVLNAYFKSWLTQSENDQLVQYFREEKVVGDIGGHLIAPPKAKNDDDLVNFLNTLNRRILATQPNDFISVASRYLKGRIGAGVMGIATGARKAKVLYTLLSQDPCPVSRLVLDSHCALALLYLIDPKEFKDFIAGKGKRHAEKSEEWSEGTRRLIPIKVNY